MFDALRLCQAAEQAANVLKCESADDQAGAGAAAARFRGLLVERRRGLYPSAIGADGERLDDVVVVVDRPEAGHPPRSRTVDRLYRAVQAGNPFDRARDLFLEAEDAPCAGLVVSLPGMDVGALISDVLCDVPGSILVDWRELMLVSPSYYAACYRGGAAAATECVRGSMILGKMLVEDALKARRSLVLVDDLAGTETDRPELWLGQFKRRGYRTVLAVYGDTDDEALLRDERESAEEELAAGVPSTSVLRAARRPASWVVAARAEIARLLSSSPLGSARTEPSD